jgi:hypothetical protein
MAKKKAKKKAKALAELRTRVELLESENERLKANKHNHGQLCPCLLCTREEDLAND